MFKQGESYLLIEDSLKKVCSLFKGVLKDERKALVIWRNHPIKECEYQKSLDISTLWLTNINTSAVHLKPTEIEQLSYTIEKYMSENQGCAVMFCSIDYLISYNDFNEVLHLIQSIKDFAAEYSATFFVYVGKNTIDEKQEALLKQELNYDGEK
jgi:hypothetical protein